MVENLVIGGVLALIGPWLLLVVEKGMVWQLGVVVEEIFKLGLIVLIVGKKRNVNRKKIFILALAFVISESVLYLVNSWLLADLSLFFKRLFLTGSMHVLTFFLLYGGVEKRKWWLGLILAGGVHWCFNHFVI